MRGGEKKKYILYNHAAEKEQSHSLTHPLIHPLTPPPHTFSVSVPQGMYWDFISG